MFHEQRLVNMHEVFGCTTAFKVQDFLYHDKVLTGKYCLCIAHDRQQDDVADNGKEN